MTEINPNVDINPNAEEIANLEAQIAGIDVNTLDPNDNGKLKQESQVVEEKVQQTVENKVEESTENSTDDLIKTELERVKGQTQGKTPKEKFEYKLKLQLSQAKEMGIDVAGLAGIKQSAETNEEEADKPLTRKDLESILSSVKPQSKSATEMALEIDNEAERELHLYYLDNKINPSLTEEEKFQTAKEMVNAIKLKNQVSLNNIRPEVQRNSTASSIVPNKQANFDQYKLTPEEDMFFRDAQTRGVPLTKEEIIKMRR